MKYAAAISPAAMKATMPVRSPTAKRRPETMRRRAKVWDVNRPMTSYMQHLVCERHSGAAPDGPGVRRLAAAFGTESCGGRPWHAAKAHAPHDALAPGGRAAPGHRREHAPTPRPRL